MILIIICGACSGYKAITPNLMSPSRNIPPCCFPLKYATDGFIYLGGCIPNVINRWNRLLQKMCKLGFDRGSYGPVCLIMLVSFIQVSISFCTHACPYWRRIFFRLLDQLISSFLWGNKTFQGTTLARVGPDRSRMFWFCPICHIRVWDI